MQLEKEDRRGQKHILRDRRPSTAALPSLLGGGNKGDELVSGEEKNILYWAA